MARIHVIVAALLAALLLVAPASVKAAADNSSAEIEQLKKDIEQLKKQLAGSSMTMPKSKVEEAVAGKFGPNAPVTTRSGKLTIGGLLQAWYYQIQKGNHGLFDGTNGGAVFDTSAASNCDSFRIRRAELSLTMDIHENVRAFIDIDPAREATSFPALPDNKGNFGPNNIFKVAPNVAPEFDAANGPGLGSTTAVSSVEQGAGKVPRLLKDAYVNYHGVTPHHDFTIGEFRPQIGEEGPKSSADLDFVERSMIGQLCEDRDLGVQVHGSWWGESPEGNGRLQYTLGAFDSAGGYFQSNMNRADTNSEKDFQGSIMLRPVWKSDPWGSVEIGYSWECGRHGHENLVGRDPINNPINGVNIENTWAWRHAAWASYRPQGPVRGWWLKGEFQMIHDRPPAAVVADLAGAGGTDYIEEQGGAGTAQSGGTPLSIKGWYLSTGIKLSESVLADSAPSWLKPWEFAIRYEEIQNVWVADLNNPQATDVFKTRVYTVGVNYYIKKNNAKIQANYNWVENPTTSVYDFHRVRNNNLMLNFQVAF